MNQGVCPACGHSARNVPVFTVRSLTKEEFIRTLPDDDYYFCGNPDCEIAYFSALSEATVSKNRLKVRVGVKEKDESRPVCYCFYYTVEEIHREIRETGQTTVEKNISAKIEAGYCHCEDANPEGRCCLGNVAVAVREGFRLCGVNKQERAVSTKDCC